MNQATRTKQKLKQRWDAAAYRRIEAARFHDGELSVRFGDGSEVVIMAATVLPPNVQVSNGVDVSIGPLHLSLPSSQGDIEIPWDVIRVLTDPEFEAHRAEMARKVAKQIGARIRKLREEQRISIDALAKVTEVSREKLVRIEEGHGQADFALLERIMGAMGDTSADLLIASAPATVD